VHGFRRFGPPALANASTPFRQDHQGKSSRTQQGKNGLILSILHLFDVPYALHAGDEL